MKKLIAVFFAFVLLMSTSLAAESLSPFSLLPGYGYYSELFGAAEIQADIDVDKTETGKGIMSLGNVSVVYSNSTLEPEYAILFYGYMGETGIDNDLQALGFFAALEYGAPSKYDDKEVKDARSAALPVYTEMKSVIKTKSDQLKAGEYIPFFIGTNVIYTLWMRNDLLMVMAE